MNPRKIFELILKLLFLVIIISFIVLNPLSNFYGMNVEFFVLILFFLFILDIYLLFVLYAATVTYLDKNTKQMLIAGSTITFVLSLIFMILGIALNNAIFIVLMVLIGLPSMLGFSAYLRSKRGSTKSDYDDII